MEIDIYQIRAALLHKEKINDIKLGNKFFNEVSLYNPLPPN